jgi:hypothetical protein
MKTWLYIIFLFGGNFLLAQVRFTVEVPKQDLEVGQQFQITYRMNRQGSSFEPPSFSGFIYEGGPVTGINSSIGTNGATITFSYTYYLKAATPGKFPLEPAYAKISGKLYRTEAKEITVVEPKQISTGGKDDQLFLKSYVSDRTVYIGEPIYVNSRIYTRIDVDKYQITSEPNLKGFYKENVAAELNDERREFINGKQYITKDISKTLIIPQEAGVFSLGVFALDIDSYTVKRDRYGRRRTVYQKNTLEDALPKITVRRLPEKGRPPNFSGAVGKFKMTTSVSNKSVSLDGSISLKIRIEGNGNIKLVDLPEPNFPSGFEVFDPEIRERSKVGPDGMVGFKEIEYLLVPRYSGTYKLEPFEFSFFDTKKGNYKRIKSQLFDLEIKGTKPGPNSLNMAGGEKTDVDYLNKDILFIKTSSGAWLNLGERFFGSSRFWVFLCLPFLVMAALLFFWKRRQSEFQNHASLRKLRAGKAAQKKLQKAQKALEENGAEDFYQELAIAIWGFFGDKFGLRTSTLNKQMLQELLTKSSVDESLIQALLALIEKSEMARFTGLQIQGAAHDYSEAGSLLTEIEKQL